MEIQATALTYGTFCLLNIPISNADAVLTHYSNKAYWPDFDVFEPESSQQKGLKQHTILTVTEIPRYVIKD